ncbi:MAG: SymE family type I addiction module toxin [Tannerellaceae bacterium]|nr:SymE family type I addiction module toxin [Tannerellaceae bacterium]
MPNNFKETNNVKVVACETSPQGFKSRFLTLCRKARKLDKDDKWYYTPTVTLAGQWLYDAGFRSGQRIELVIGDRQIVMRVDREPSEGLSERQLVREVARLQKQLQEVSELVEPFAGTDRVKRCRGQRKGVFAG